MLFEVGCKNVETFTYGRKNVRDFAIARQISEKLGVVKSSNLYNTSNGIIEAKF